MRIGRSLTVCRSLLLGGRGVVCSRGGGICPGGVCSGGVSAPGGLGGSLLLGGRGVSAPGGVSALWGCLLLGGCLLQGGLLWGVSAPGGVSTLGVSAWGCLLSGGVCSEGGCGIPACTEADSPPVDRITDVCKNITLATTSLRPVNIVKVSQWRTG